MCYLREQRSWSQGTIHWNCSLELEVRLPPWAVLWPGPSMSLCSLRAPYAFPFPTASLFLLPCQSNKDQHDYQVTQSLTHPLLCLPSSFLQGRCVCCWLLRKSNCMCVPIDGHLLSSCLLICLFTRPNMYGSGHMFAQVPGDTDTVPSGPAYKGAWFIYFLKKIIIVWIWVWHRAIPPALLNVVAWIMSKLNHMK